MPNGGSPGGGPRHPGIGGGPCLSPCGGDLLLRSGRRLLPARLECDRRLREAADLCRPRLDLDLRLDEPERARCGIRDGEELFLERDRFRCATLAG